MTDNTVYVLNDVRHGNVHAFAVYHDRQPHRAIERAFEIVVRRKPDALDSKKLAAIRRTLKKDGQIVLENQALDRMVQVCRVEMED